MKIKWLFQNPRCRQNDKDVVSCVPQFPFGIIHYPDSPSTPLCPEGSFLTKRKPLADLSCRPGLNSLINSVTHLFYMHSCGSPSLYQVPSKVLGMQISGNPALTTGKSSRRDGINNDWNAEQEAVGGENRERNRVFGERKGSGNESQGSCRNSKKRWGILQSKQSKQNESLTDNSLTRSKLFAFKRDKS